MAHQIEPALLPGHLVHEITGEETIGIFDDHAQGDTPIQRLADHAGIDLKQAQAVMAWFRLEEKDAVIEAAAEMLGRLFGLIIPPEGRIRLDLIGQKFVAMHFLMNRSGTATLTGIAERSGVSKQLLDHHVNALGRKFGFHGVGQKREGTREAYAEAQREIWARLTPEERKARRAGKAAATATQGATPAAQFDSEEEVTWKNSPPHPNSPEKQESPLPESQPPLRPD